MVDYTKNGRDGTWNDLDIGSANASVYKRTTESNITLTAGSISKKATITLPDSVAKNFDVGEYMFLFSQQHLLPANIEAKDVKGTLYFKQIWKVTSDQARYASYNDDRIVFYQDDFTGRDFVAYVCFSLVFFTV
jgi:hypothetical protein